MSDFQSTGPAADLSAENVAQGSADGHGGQSPGEMAAAAAATVKQEVSSFAAATQDKVQDKIEDKKQIATKTMSDFASAVRHAGEELAQHDQSAVGRVVKQAADALEHVSRTVADKRPEQFLDAARDFGRSNPAAFIAGSVLLGVALGRFARSSQTHRSDPPPALVPSQGFETAAQDSDTGTQTYQSPGASELQPPLGAEG